MGEYPKNLLRVYVISAAAAAPVLKACHRHAAPVGANRALTQRSRHTVPRFTLIPTDSVTAAPCSLVKSAESGSPAYDVLRPFGI